MRYAPAEGPIEQMVYARVGGNGFGPYYQRLAWAVVANMPMPDTEEQWGRVWEHVDTLYPDGNRDAQQG